MLFRSGFKPGAIRSARLSSFDSYFPIIVSSLISSLFRFHSFPLLTLTYITIAFVFSFRFKAQLKASTSLATRWWRQLPLQNIVFFGFQKWVLKTEGDHADGGALHIVGLTPFLEPRLLLSCPLFAQPSRA